MSLPCLGVRVGDGDPEVGVAVAGVPGLLVVGEPPSLGRGGRGLGAAVTPSPALRLDVHMLILPPLLQRFPFLVSVASPLVPLLIR